MSEHDLPHVAFPSLTEAQMTTLGRDALAPLKRYRDGEKLFEVGARDFKFFVVRSGKVEIVDESGETPRTIRVHGPGEFTGDVAQLTGRPSLVSSVARGDCEVYEVPADALRQIVNNRPDLGDVILRAFIARRQLLSESGSFTGLRVIGSRSSRDRFRVRDFWAKNQYGQVGCCSSPNRHATEHYKHTAHLVMASFEPGERWTWCYIDQADLEVPKLVTPHLR